MGGIRPRFNRVQEVRDKHDEDHIVSDIWIMLLMLRMLSEMMLAFPALLLGSSDYSP